jgi:hypothetical protein
MLRIVKSCLAVLLLNSLPAFAGSPTLPKPTAFPEVAAELQESRLRGVEQVMLHLNAGEQNTAMIPEVYAPDVLFVDPLFPEGLRGYEALQHYHTALNSMIESFEVDVSELQQQGNEVLVYWKAKATINVKANLGQALKKAGLPTLGHKLEINLMKIGPVAYDGVTRFGFAEGSAQINFHKDIYDSLAQYETIPGLKQVLGVVKEQNRKALGKSN